MSATNWAGRSIGGRYQIEALLGQGGMSAVYKAMDPNLRRTVAVKLIHSHLSNDPEFVRRFEQEAAAVAQLRHPNIIQVYDFDHDAEVYYMVLEYVAGETLQSRLKALHAEDRQMPLEEAVSVMATICDAVEYAHRRKMIHRDIKPGNVMLDPEGKPILMDFGVAKMVGGQQHTASGAIIGTVAYMSPEQIRGANVDERADIYSLGIMLYEMTAGRPPFEGDSAMTVMFKHVNEPPPDIQQFNASVPDDLKAVIQKALAKEPRDRFQTAAEMAAALRALKLVSVPATPEALAPAMAASGVAVPPRSAEAASYSVVSQSRARMASQSGLTPRPPTDQSGLATASLATSAPAPSVIGASPATAQPATTPAIRKQERTGLGAFVWIALGVAGIAVLAFAAFAAWWLLGRGGSGLPVAQGMIHINGGNYLVGREASGDGYAPPQQAKLDEFWLDRFEVTNAEYAEFVKATGAAAPSSWTGGAAPAGQDHRPVHGVTWQQAADYCQWVHKRLPHEAEWEVAARGPNSFLFPWGNNADTVDLPRDDTYDVGTIAANRSYFGAFDMAGNVWEWVADPYAPVPAGHQVLRGGAYNFSKDMAYRLEGDPSVPTMIADAGFRCAAPQVSGATVAETAAPLPTEALEGVLYIDEFANPNSGWPVSKTTTTTIGYHPQSFYHLELAVPNDRLIVTRQLGFANYLAETEVLVDHISATPGDFRYGLALRRTGDNYYAVTISSRAKTWKAEMITAGAAKVLAEGADEAIKGGQDLNLLQVAANGPNFTISINRQAVGQFTDATYTAGEVGFILQTLDQTLAHVHFASLILREVQPVAATAAPATLQPTAAPTQTRAAPTNTAAAPTDTPAPTLEPTATAAPVVAPEGMVFVPAGSFDMGSSRGQPDERPIHPVTLSAFFIDKYEVTNDRYRKCVEAGACRAPMNRGSFTRANYFTVPEFGNFPVIQVTWEQARAFCTWEGRRLPTEAEWEYAARGGANQRFPWGDDFDPTRVPAQVPDTVEVGTLDNASLFGVYDLAGNVNEWVADWYAATYYTGSPADNPAGPDRGTRRVYRGGSYDNTNGTYYTVSRRYNQLPGFHDADIGFRCAQNVP